MYFIRGRWYKLISFDLFNLFGTFGVPDLFGLVVHFTPMIILIALHEELVPFNRD